MCASRAILTSCRALWSVGSGTAERGVRLHEKKRGVGRSNIVNLFSISDPSHSPSSVRSRSINALSADDEMNLASTLVAFDVEVGSVVGALESPGFHTTTFEVRAGSGAQSIKTLAAT
jgi:hypothetical protein